MLSISFQVLFSTIISADSGSIQPDPLSDALLDWRFNTWYLYPFERYRFDVFIFQVCFGRAFSCYVAILQNKSLFSFTY